MAIVAVEEYASFPLPTKVAMVAMVATEDVISLSLVFRRSLPSLVLLFTASEAAGDKSFSLRSSEDFSVFRVFDDGVTL